MEQFREALKAFLVECCRQLAGEPPQLRRWTRVVRKDGGQISLPTEIRPDFYQSLFRFRIHYLKTEMPAFNPLVEVVRKDPRLRGVLLTNSGGTPITNAEIEVWWIENHLAVPFLHAYVDKAGGFQFDEGIFDELFDDLRRDIESLDITVTELSPLMNVEIESDQIQVDHNIQVRRLSTDELEGWLNPVDAGFPFTSSRLTFHELLRLKSAIEVIYQKKRYAPSGSTVEAHEKVWRLVTAMRLLTDASPRVAFVARTLSCLARGFGTWEGPLPLLGPSAKIEKSQESRLVELYRKVESSPNLTKIKLGLARWNSAGDRLTEEDRLIDYWIALESLFVPETRQRVTHRTAQRIAAFLGSDGGERGRIYEQMKESYNLRSEIVHGSIRKRERKLPSGELINVTRSYLRQSLLKTLESGVSFDPSTLEVQLLGKE